MRQVEPLSDNQTLLWGGAREVRGKRRSDGTRENPETPLVRFVREWVRDHPGLLDLRRTHSGVSFRGPRKLYHGAEGGLDYLGGTCFGAVLAVECKSEIGELSDEQVETIARYREWGWIVIVCHSPGEFVALVRQAFEERGHPIPFA